MRSCSPRQELRRRHDQFPRLDRLRTEVYRLHQRRLGRQPYVDLMKGLDYVEKTYPFIDKDREAASARATAVTWPTGFRPHQSFQMHRVARWHVQRRIGIWHDRGALVQNWEFGGPPVDQTRRLPEMVATRVRTEFQDADAGRARPTRLPARLRLKGSIYSRHCKRLKVPSKMLYFPDEGHWVLKPQNSQLWYKTVNAWVDQWCAATRTGR